MLAYGFVGTQLALCGVVSVMSRHSLWSPYRLVELLTAGLSGVAIYAMRTKRCERVLIGAYLLFTALYSLWVTCHAIPFVYNSRHESREVRYNMTWISVEEVDAFVASGRNVRDVNELMSSCERMVSPYKLHFPSTHISPSLGTRSFMRWFVLIELAYFVYVMIGCVALCQASNAIDTTTPTPVMEEENEKGGGSLSLPTGDCDHDSDEIALTSASNDGKGC